MEEVYHCGVCGKACEGGSDEPILGWKYGVHLTYSDSDSFGIVTYRVCEECANRIVPIFKKAIEEAKAKAEMITKQEGKL